MRLRFGFIWFVGCGPAGISAITFGKIRVGAAFGWVAVVFLRVRRSFLR